MSFCLKLICLAAVLSVLLGSTKKPESDFTIHVVKKEALPMQAYGLVEVAKKISLKPSVSGRLIEVSPCFDLGCIISRGELLAKIDPTSFITDLEVEMANVKKAEYECKLEMGRHNLAAVEWELIGKDLNATGGEDLVLRKPQLDDKRAQLRAAEKKREKAERNLKNTEIRAPFDSIVLHESAYEGQMVATDASMGDLVSIDRFRVIVKFPFELLCKAGCIAGQGFFGEKVSVVQDLGDFTEEWEGTVVRILSSLEEGGRDAKVMVEIEDPLGRLSPEQHLVPLLLGSRVLVRFNRPLIQESFAVPENALRGGEVLILGKDGSEIPRKVKVELIDQKTAYITKGLEEGESVVIRK